MNTRTPSSLFKERLHLLQGQKRGVCIADVLDRGNPRDVPGALHDGGYGEYVLVKYDGPLNFKDAGLITAKNWSERLMGV